MPVIQPTVVQRQQLQQQPSYLDRLLAQMTALAQIGATVYGAMGQQKYQDMMMGQQRLQWVKEAKDEGTSPEEIEWMLVNGAGMNPAAAKQFANQVWAQGRQREMEAKYNGMYGEGNPFTPGFPVSGTPDEYGNPFQLMGGFA